MLLTNYSARWASALPTHLYLVQTALPNRATAFHCVWFSLCLLHTPSISRALTVSALSNLCFSGDKLSKTHVIVMIVVPLALVLILVRKLRDISLSSSGRSLSQYASLTPLSPVLLIGTHSASRCWPPPVVIISASVHIGASGVCSLSVVVVVMRSSGAGPSYWHSCQHD